VEEDLLEARALDAERTDAPRGRQSLHVATRSRARGASPTKSSAAVTRASRFLPVSPCIEAKKARFSDPVRLS